MTGNTLGKIGGALLAETILAHLGAADPEVLTAPRSGVDIGVLRVAPGVVMAVTTDPVFVLRSLGWEQAAWFAVHILASDAATSGLPLRAMSVDLNLPAELPDNDLATLWQAYAGACEELGIAVVSGHTGRYAGCTWPMVGGATCLALGPEDSYITPTMARAGDRVVVTKGAAIEATALLAMSFPDRLRNQVGTDTLAAAQRLVRSMTVVPEARAAAAYGVRDAGVTAMHDATEGGVLGGLYEVAEASGVGLRIDQSAIPIRPEVAAVCAAAGIDPYFSISEGTLVATVRPQHAEGLLAVLANANISAADVGEVLPAGAARTMLDADGREVPLTPPGLDPYWEAFARWSAQ
jgi:hydrogenase expression/formation protein HypE